MSNIVQEFTRNMMGQQPLSQLGAGVSQIVQQKRAQQAAKAQQEAYNGAWNNYLGNRSPENRAALLKATPTARLESTQKFFGNMDTEQRTNEVQGNIEILSYLDGNYTEEALNMFNKRADAFEAAGDTQNASKNRFLAEKLQGGDVQKVKSFLLGALNSIPEGQKALDGLHEVDKNRREETASDLSIAKAGDSISFPDEEARRNWKNQITNAGFSTDLVNKLAATTKIIGESGISTMTEEQRTAERAKIRAEYWNMTDDYRTVSASYTNAMAAAKRGEELASRVKDIDAPTEDDKATVGVADLELVTSVTRIMDPGQGVRQNDVDNAKKTGSLGAALIGGLQRLANGQLLTVGQRAEFKKLAERNMKNASTQLDTAEEFLRGPLKHAGISEDSVFVDRSKLQGYELGSEYPEEEEEENSLLKYRTEAIDIMTEMATRQKITLTDAQKARLNDLTEDQLILYIAKLKEKLGNME